MQDERSARPTGHVQVDQIGKSETGAARYRYKALWRDADGRHQRVLGRAHVKPTRRRTPRGAIVWRTADGPKPDGFLTPAEAEERLRSILTAAPRISRRPRERKTFQDAAEQWFEHGVKHSGRDGRGWKPSTRRDYRNVLDTYLRPTIGSIALERLSAEDARRSLDPLPARTRQKVQMIASEILEFAKSEGLVDENVIAEQVKPVRLRYDGHEIQMFSPEEVRALVRCVESGEHRSPRAPAGGVHATEAAAARRRAEDLQDGALLLTAAFTGLRLGELLALRWRDVDFGGSVVRVARSYSAGSVTTPKSGKVRSVPMAPDVAEALARLSQRGDFRDDDDLVFPSETGKFLDASALRRRYKRALKAAGLRPLRLHDLRHVFGSQVIARADVRRVQEWLGHADVQTTSRYLHYVPRTEDARLVAEAFAPPSIENATTKPEEREHA